MISLSYGKTTPDVKIMASGVIFMNEKGAENRKDGGNTICCTSLAPYAPAQRGCLAKIRGACRKACDRFFSTKVSVSYRMILHIYGDALSGEKTNTADLPAWQEKEGRNKFFKEGELEIRLADLALGLSTMALIYTVIGVIKRILP